jgi:hypothetical protein
LIECDGKSKEGIQESKGLIDQMAFVGSPLVLLMMLLLDAEPVQSE